MLSELQRGIHLLRTEGPKTVLTHTRDYLDRVQIDRSGVTISYQQGARVDFETRYELISEELTDDNTALIDIGCAEGDFAARFAADGLVSLGIERQNHAVVSARNRHRDQANLGFLEYEITPETIGTLPEPDVILLLTVYHHWVREYGEETAAEMLRETTACCDRLFFEMPASQVIDGAPHHESIVLYYTTYLDDVLPDGTVTFLGTTDYKGGDRDDVLFMIE